jgi:hypothetical protein
MPTTVTTSTSVVLVATSLNTPPYVVLLPNIGTVGRIITVRDNDGFASFANNILLSTTAGAIFSDGTNAISINQPYGFITFNTNPNGVYYILNTFAFPAGQAAANVSNLTASSITTRQIYFTDTGTPSTNVLFTSSSQLYLNSTPLGEVTQSNLNSTIIGLGTFGYLSSLNANIPPVWVAVGQPSSIVVGSKLGSIQYSTDSFTWLNASATSGFFNKGNSVAYGNGLLVAVGENDDGAGPNLGYNQWSFDGINWNNSISPAMAGNQYRLQVNYNNGLWHSVGATPLGGPRTIQWSTDGKTWNDTTGYPQGGGYPFPSGSGASGFATGITYGNGVWVASGFCESVPGAGILWSSDGSNWSNATSTSWTGSYIKGVAFNGSRFVCLPLNGLNPTTFASNIAYSTDGKSWSSSGITGGNLNNDANQVSGNEYIWLITSGGAANQGQYLIWSTDALTWNSNTTFSGCNNTSRLTDPYYDGATWWVGLENNASTQGIFYSGDGISWSRANVTSRFISSGFPNSFAVKPGQSNNNLLLVSAITGVFLEISTSVTTALLTVSSINMTGKVNISADLTSIAIGNQAGNAQGTGAIAIGLIAGGLNQQNNAVAIGVSAGENTQGSLAIAIGSNAGRLDQNTNAIAIGNDAGNNTQGVNAIAIGNNAAPILQNANTIVLNASGNALNTTAANALFVKPIRNAAPTGASTLFYSPGTGEITYGTSATSTSSFTTLDVGTLNMTGNVNITAVSSNIAIGKSVASTVQGFGAIAIGVNAGYNLQQTAAIAIGQDAGSNNQQNGAIAIGQSAGLLRQSTSAVAIGVSAGSIVQGQNTVAIGNSAGYNIQGASSIAIGNEAGFNAQGINSIAIGTSAGKINQHGNSIILNASGNILNTTTTNSFVVKPIRNAAPTGASTLFYSPDSGEITYGASVTTTSSFTTLNVNTISSGFLGVSSINMVDKVIIRGSSIQIGNSAGIVGQGEFGIAIGNNAGCNTQGLNAIAIGRDAGSNTQSFNAVAIGTGSGKYFQGSSAVAIGSLSGCNSQGINSIAIGRLAGYNQQGENAIAIGYNAGFNTQSPCTIVLNASGDVLDAFTGANRFYVKPIRNDTTVSNILFYSPGSSEITYESALSLSNFVNLNVYTPCNFTFSNDLNTDRVRLVREIPLGFLIEDSGGTQKLYYPPFVYQGGILVPPFGIFPSFTNQSFGTANTNALSLAPRTVIQMATLTFGGGTVYTYSNNNIYNFSTIPGVVVGTFLSYALYFF